MHKSFQKHSKEYLTRLYDCFSDDILEKVEDLAHELAVVWEKRKRVYICGNGGSAANALHMANDFHYGIGACGTGNQVGGLKVEALPANVGVMTCLANDIGYEHVYSNQLEIKAESGDILIVLSGSGNSANVVNALESANKMNIKSYAIVAFTGGKCKKLATVPIHIPVNDMQIAEDTQLVIGHICMQWLSMHKPF